MTTADAAFRARLEPEATVQDLDQRARKGIEICLTACASGNADLAGRAFARVVSRWTERDALMAAPDWVWVGRHKAASAVLDAVPPARPEWALLLDAVYAAFYVTLARASGERAEDAERYAYVRNQNRKALEAGQ